MKGQSNLSPKSSQNSKRKWIAKAKTSLSAAEGTIASVTGSSWTASKSVSEGRDEQDQGRSQDLLSGEAISCRALRARRKFC